MRSSRAARVSWYLVIRVVALALSVLSVPLLPSRVVSALLASPAMPASLATPAKR
jgi:hypothetical protein